MLYAWIIALCVGGATMLGGVLGFFIKYQNARADGAVFSFAAGVMITASFAELILPVAAAAEPAVFYLCLSGLILGGGVIFGMQKLMELPQRKQRRRGILQTEADPADGTILFVAAIAIHNLPEGIAAGAALGNGDFSRAVAVAAGIALQNIPEGMIVLPPLVHIGVSRKKALLVSVLTGVIEIFGTFLGYFAASVTGAVLPFLLCLAGGAMLYIIATDITEDANRLAGKTLSGFSFLLGCCAMVLMEKYL